MKKTFLILLIAVLLAGVGAPLYAQSATLTLESLAEKVEAMVELVTSLSDRMNDFEVRLAALEGRLAFHPPRAPPCGAHGGRQITGDVGFEGLISC